MARRDLCGVRVRPRAGHDREHATVGIAANLPVVLVDEGQRPEAEVVEMILGFGAASLAEFRRIDQDEPDPQTALDVESVPVDYVRDRPLDAQTGGSWTLRRRRRRIWRRIRRRIGRRGRRPRRIHRHDRRDHKTHEGDYRQDHETTAEHQHPKGRNILEACLGYRSLAGGKNQRECHDPNAKYIARGRVGSSGSSQ